MAFMLRLLYLQPNNKTEQKFIYNTFMHPSFYFAIVFGITLISLNTALLSTGAWFYVKLFIISLLILVHHHCKLYMQENTLVTPRLALLPLILGSIVVILTLTKAF